MFMSARDLALIVKSDLLELLDQGNLESEVAGFLVFSHR